MPPRHPVSSIRFDLRLFIAGLVLAVATAFAATTARADEAAEAYVKSLGNEAIAILSNEELTAEDERSQFRDLLLGAIDVRRIGLFAIGPYRRTATPEQQEAYFDLLEDFIVEIYYGRLSAYTNEDFTVLDSAEKGSKGREVIVKSQIAFTDGREPVPVEWWLIRNGDGFRVFDVKVVGIWMAQEQQSTFMSHIRNNGNRFDALLEHLRNQIEAGRRGELTTGSTAPMQDGSGATTTGAAVSISQ